MQQSPLVQAALTEALWIVGGVVAGLIATLACIVLLAQGRRLPGLVTGAGAGLVGLATVFGGVAGLWNPDRYTGTLAASVIHLLGAFGTLPLAGLTLLAMAALGAKSPRDPRLAVLLAALALAAAGATYAEGVAGGNQVFGAVRAAVIGGTGLLTSVSALSVDDRRPVAVASVTWALVVAAVEGAERGLVTAFALANTVRLVPYEKRPEAIERMLEHVAPELPWAWLALGLAGLAAVIGVGVGLRSPDGRLAHASGLLWLLVLPASLLFGLPSQDDLNAAAAAGPPPSVTRSAPAPAP